MLQNGLEIMTLLPQPLPQPPEFRILSVGHHAEPIPVLLQTLNRSYIDFKNNFRARGVA
jgi:hypothetical protein